MSATRPRKAGSYVELHCHSAFSLLDGAALPEALVARAAALGYPALALTDHDDLGGAVRFAQAAHDAGIGGIVGVELTVDVKELTHLVLLAETRTGYANISTLVSRARLEQARGTPCVSLDLLAAHADGVFALTGCARGWVPARLAAGDPDGARHALGTLADIYDGRIAVECWDHHLLEERALVRELIPLARWANVPWTVTNDVHYVHARDRLVHDVLCALRHEQPLESLGTRLRPSGEWHLKSAAAMRRRWRERPEGLDATLAIAERCAFRMHELEPTLPAFPLPPGVTADEYLERLVVQGAHERWGMNIELRAADCGLRERRTLFPQPAARSPQHEAQLRHELSMIRSLSLAGYFLIVWDIVRFARREGILCQGRGSAANSAVCYCLGITAVDPIKLGLLFERFLSPERTEAPDIDIDFAHRERERVIQYVYERYGREHAAMVCEQITWRGRSAVRDAARVLGLSVEQGERLAVMADRFSARATAERLRDGDRGDGAAAIADGMIEALGQSMVRGTEATTRAREVKEGVKQQLRAAGAGLREERSPFPHPAPRSPESAVPSLAARAGLDPHDRRVRAIAEIVDGLHQLPRHRSIHVGGFVLTAEPLSRIVPIEPASMPDRTVIQWEKDDLDPVGLVKIDLLGLGMLTLLQDCLVYIKQTRGVQLDLAQLDMTDQAVYDDMCRADTIGVFQIESRAQMNTLPRLKPRQFYDLVVEVALIRPGPIQGDMVHPYLRRRAGVEQVTYPHPSLEPILKRTLGVPLFQEQGMQVAIACAGFTPGEADQLRRAMGHKRSRERMAAICQKLIDGMQANGIAEDVALRIYNQINAFADYGFPESHAASFALIVYASAYLKHYYAPEFTAALLNAQPMGFYSVGTIIEDAKRHGVVVRPVDLSRSAWDSTLELPVLGARCSVGSRGEPSTEHRSPAVGRSQHSAPSPQPPALRLGLRLVRGLGSAARAKLEGALADGPFTSIADVVTRTRLDRRALRLLAEAGAFDAFLPEEPDLRRRRAALWRVLDAARGDAGPLAPRAAERGVAPVPVMTPVQLTEADYRMTGVSLHGHPMRHLRELLAPNGIRTAHDLCTRGRDGERIAMAGLVICRQRPGTAKGFVFLTLEDETGLVNVVVTPQRFERDALLISTSPLLLVRGTLQVEQTVVNIRADLFRALDASVGAEHARSHDFH